MVKKNAYDRFKSKNGGFDKSLLEKEETYFVGAAVPAILFAGILDGGVSVALAYGASKLYKMKNG